MAKKKNPKGLKGKIQKPIYEVKIGSVKEAPLVKQAMDQLEKKKVGDRFYPDGSLIPKELPLAYEQPEEHKGDVCANCIWFYKNECSKYVAPVRNDWRCGKFSWINQNMEKSYTIGNTRSGSSDGNRETDVYSMTEVSPDGYVNPLKRHRFFDDVLQDEYLTVNGSKAKFATSASGTITDWAGRKVKIALELVYKDGSRTLEDELIAVIQNIKTSRNSELATIKLESIVKPMMDGDAAKVKDGFDWYKNRPISFLVNELLKEVYQDEQGDLPPEKTISGESIEVGTVDGRAIWFDMGVPNSWDGSTFNEVLDAINVTAMCSGARSINDTTQMMYVAVAGADYPPSRSELYSVDTRTNLWTLLSEYSEGNAHRIKRLEWNYELGELFGYSHKDDVNRSSDIWGLDSAGQALTTVKSVFPDINIIYWNPINSSGKLDDSINHKNLSKCFTGKWTFREGMDNQANKYDFNDADKTLGMYPSYVATEKINGMGGRTTRGEVNSSLSFAPFQSNKDAPNSEYIGINTDWLIKDTSSYFNTFKLQGPYRGPQFRNLHSLFTGPSNGHQWCGTYSTVGGWRGARQVQVMGHSFFFAEWNWMNMTNNDYSYKHNTNGIIIPTDYLTRQGGENISLHAMGKQIFIGGMGPESIRYHRAVRGYDTNMEGFTASNGGVYRGGQWYSRNPHDVGRTTTIGGSYSDTRSQSFCEGRPVQPWQDDFPSPGYFNSGEMMKMNLIQGSYSQTYPQSMMSPRRNDGRPGLRNYLGNGVRSHIMNLNMIGSDPNEYVAPLQDGTKVVHGLYGQVARHTAGLRADQHIGMNPDLYTVRFPVVDYDYNTYEDTPPQFEAVQAAWRKTSGLGDTSLWGYAQPNDHTSEMTAGHHKYMGMAGPYGAYPWVLNASPWQIPSISGTSIPQADSLTNYASAIMDVDEDRHRSGAGGVGWLSCELFNHRSVIKDTQQGGGQRGYGGWDWNTYNPESIFDDVRGRGYSGSDIPTRFSINAVYSNNQQGMCGVVVPGLFSHGGMIFATADSNYGGYIDHYWATTDCASGARMVTGPFKKNSYELGYVGFDCKRKIFKTFHNMAGPTMINSSDCWSATKDNNDVANDFSTRQPTAAVAGTGEDSNKLYLATTTWDSYTLAHGARDYSLVYLDGSKPLSLIRNMWGISYHGAYSADTGSGVSTVDGHQGALTTSFFFNEDAHENNINPIRCLMSMGTGGQRDSYVNQNSWNNTNDHNDQNMIFHVSLVSDTANSGNTYICAGHSPDTCYNGATDKNDMRWPVSFVWTSTNILPETTYHIAVTRTTNKIGYGGGSDRLPTKYNLYINGILQDSTQGYSISGFNYSSPDVDSAGQYVAVGYGGTPDDYRGKPWFPLAASPCTRAYGYDGGNIELHWGAMVAGRTAPTLYTGNKNNVNNPNWNDEGIHIFEGYADAGFGAGQGALAGNKKANLRAYTDGMAPDRRNVFKGHMWMMGVWNYALPHRREGGITGTWHKSYIETVEELYNDGLGRHTSRKDYYMTDTFLPVLCYQYETYDALETSSDLGNIRSQDSAGLNENQKAWADSSCLSYLRYTEPCKNTNGGWEEHYGGPSNYAPDSHNMNGADEFGNPITENGGGKANPSITNTIYQSWNGNTRNIEGSENLLPGWQDEGEMIELSRCRIRAKTEIHEITFSDGGDGKDPQFPQIRTYYESGQPGSDLNGDNSVTAPVMGRGLPNNFPVSTDISDPTRSILWLNYNSGMNKKLQGWSMRRSTIFTNERYSGSYYEHCNEVFVYDPDNDENQLTIVDVDMPDGNITNATAFGPFLNPQFDNTFKSSDSLARVYYFRMSDPSDGAGNQYFFRQAPLKIQYIENNGSLDVGGHYWDNAVSSYTSSSPGGSIEKFTSGQQAAVVLKPSSQGLIEGIWYGSSHWYNTENVLSDYVEGIPDFGLASWKNPSNQRMYQLSRGSYDPVIPLADFSDMTVFDAITKIAAAYNLIWGFDLEDIFMTKKSMPEEQEPSHTLDWRTGEILDLEKTVGDDIRNIIVGIPYEEEKTNPNWEIVMDSTSPEEGSFEGDLEIVAGDETIDYGYRTARTVMICDKSGWLDGNWFVGSNQDFGNTAGDPRPFFKFLTTSASHDCHITKPIVDYDTTTHQTLYLSSIYKGGGDKISQGDLIVIANDTDTSMGNIYTGHVESVDQVYATVTTQLTDDADNPFGFSGLNAPEGTPVQIADQQVTGGGSVFESYDVLTQSFSNEGISVLTQDAYYHADSGIVLKVSNPKAFARAQVFSSVADQTERPVMMVSSYSTDWLKTWFGDPTDTGAGGHQYGREDQPFGYVHKVDVPNRIVTIKPNPFILTDYDSATYGDISPLLPKGTIMNAWIFYPYDQTNVPIASPFYKTGWTIGGWDPEDPSTHDVNTFVQENTRFIISTKGPRLKANPRRTFTNANAGSVNRFGKKEFKLPANRFLTRYWMPIIMGEILDEYAFPKYELTIKTLWKPNISFTGQDKLTLNKIRVIDEIMFPSSEGYQIEGWLKEYQINMKTLELTFKIRSRNRV
tara:strand:- start:7719 stop:15284 length:7566 start_codon:yes stop_codon:yes gene_type:complete